MAQAYRDENDVPTLIASSNVDGQTPVRLYADPVTHRLLVDGTGGTGSITVTDGGTTVTSVTEIDFTSGATVTNGGGGIAQVAVSGSGGSTFLIPTGAVDSSNTVFVFASAPNIIIVDQGRAMQKVSSDGSINWTGTTTVTLTVAPTTDIYGFGGSGTTYQQPLSGSVDGSNLTYVWATAPTVLSVDNGRIMQKVSSNGDVNWIGTTTTVLTVAPTFDIFGLA